MRCPKVTFYILHFTFYLFLLTACSDWNTDKLGEAFVPANSQVRNYTHLVYVEYSADEVRVWGPAEHEVTAQIEGLHVALENASDSLALFVYGYPTAKDTLAQTNASLSIRSVAPYALYLAGLSLRSAEVPAIESVGQAPCYVVLPQGSKNQLWGQMRIEGPLYLTGRGSLTIRHDQTCLTAASLQCQYDVKVELSSTEGNGIELQGPMRSTLGTWDINAARHGISTPQTVTLIGGTYQGTAGEGAFLHSAEGVYVRRPTLQAFSAQSSYILDTALVAQRYDSVQNVWQQRIDTLQLQADSTYQLYLNSSKNSIKQLKPARSIARPWFLFSNSTILTSDTLYFVKSKPKK